MEVNYLALFRVWATGAILTAIPIFLLSRWLHKRWSLSIEVNKDGERPKPLHPEVVRILLIGFALVWPIAIPLLVLTAWETKDD
jgi:hypothetical protein